MNTDTVLFFKPYPFEVGQKIYIDGFLRIQEEVSLTLRKIFQI